MNIEELKEQSKEEAKLESEENFKKFCKKYIKDYHKKIDEHTYKIKALEMKIANISEKELLDAYMCYNNGSQYYK